MSSSLTVERLRELLDYDPLTGVFTWRQRTSNRVVVGQVAGCVNKTLGRLTIRIDGELNYAYRLAWLYVHGEWPTMKIDHKDRDPLNNRLDNLRLADDQQNSQNRTASGVYRTGSNRFAAKIWVNDVGKYLGVFDTWDMAHQAYVEAKQAHHPFYNHLEG